jgi:hypothetical protein
VFLERCEHAAGDLLGLVSIKAIVKASSIFVRCGHGLHGVICEAKVQIAGLEGGVAGLLRLAFRLAFGHGFGTIPCFGLTHESQSP